MVGGGGGGGGPGETIAGITIRRRPYAKTLMQGHPLSLQTATMSETKGNHKERAPATPSAAEAQIF